MPKTIRRLFVVIFLIIFMFSSCKKEENPGNNNNHKEPPVVVPSDNYEVKILQDKITLSLDHAKDYNFSSLFTVLLNEKPQEITESMVSTNYAHKVGTYTYTVSYKEISKTLTIEIIENPKIVSVTSTCETYSIKDAYVGNLDLTSFFAIQVNGVNQEVKLDYLSMKKVPSIEGTYTVTCIYEDMFSSVVITVTKSTYDIELDTSFVDVKMSMYDDFDFKSLFKVYIDEKIVAITSDMIETNVEKNVGTYSYSVSVGNITKTLIINVIEDFALEIIPSWSEVSIPLSKLQSFDYTTLFSLYFDGKAIQVTKDMIDLSNLENVEINKSYDVVLTYTVETTTKSEKVKINVLEEEQIIISSKNEIVYPNQERLDLTTLFAIKEGETIIPVENEMITGKVNYDEVGLYEITLTYKGITKKATIEVKRGVIIEYRTTDTIQIATNTNFDTYDFMNDFKVIINGIEFKNLGRGFLNLEGVDFTKPGTYDVTLTIPYNDKKIGLSGVKFTYVEKTITYVVVGSIYDIKVKEPLVILDGRASFNPYDNIDIVINGKDQSKTENPAYVDVITCYVKQISDPIDFSSVANQIVEIEVYINGPKETPVIVSYEVRIKSDITVKPLNKIIFEGTTLYTKDLFEITHNLENVQVTSSMITGKVDTFTPGVYYVEIEYLGIKEQAKVTVLNKALIGRYKTKLETIPDRIIGYDDEETVANKRTLSDLVVKADTSVVIGNKTATIIDTLDENIFKIQYGAYEYMLYYDSGIIFLDPDNSIKLGFTNDKRPMLYFSDKLYEVESKFEVSSLSTHILETTSTGYTIDVLTVKSKQDESIHHYGLKIRLVTKTSSDTVYVVNYGEVEFDPEFSKTVDLNTYLIYENERYNFLVLSQTLGKTLQTTNERLFANKTFTGQIDGKNAEIRFNQFENLELYIDGKKVLSRTNMEISSMTNGGIDYKNNMIHVYSCKNRTYNQETFSYKFIVNPQNSTFTYIAKDKYYGRYESDSMYLLLDGYGTGLICFDKSSYATTDFTYSVNDSMITIKYKNTLPTFGAGEYAKFYIDPMLNVLTLKEFYDSTFEYSRFENSEIITGAIIKMRTKQIGKDSDQIAKQALYDSIEIITKDGELSDEQKQACINTSTIRFNTPGFYQFTITVNVDGTDFVSYYAIQIIDDVYKDNPVVGIYTSGVIFEENSVEINKYGIMRINAGGLLFEGNVNIMEDNTFVGRLYDEEGNFVIANGSYIKPGLIKVRCGGYASFTDYFTTGKARVSGTEGFVLRSITIGSDITYILCDTANSIGTIITLNSINDISPSQVGAIIEVTTSSSVTTCKIVSWADAKNGLLVADKYRGIYTNNDLTLTVDGFSKASIGDLSGDYTLNDNVLTLTASKVIKVYRLNLDEKTFEEVVVALDSTLVEGKSYVASYMFYCGYYLFLAQTTFTFNTRGEVVITSVSDEHDEGSDACTEDRYDPPFVTTQSVKGMYFITGNTLTIVVGSYTFEFLITDVLNVNSFTCTKTNLSDSEHGYFSTKTIFTRK